MKKSESKWQSNSGIDWVLYCDCKYGPILYSAIEQIQSKEKELIMWIGQQILLIATKLNY